MGNKLKKWLKAMLVFCMFLLTGIAALAQEGREKVYNDVGSGNVGLTIKKMVTGDAPDYARFFTFEITYRQYDASENKWVLAKEPLTVTVDSKDPDGRTIKVNGELVSIKEVTDQPDGYDVNTEYEWLFDGEIGSDLSFSPLEGKQYIQTRTKTIRTAIGMKSFTIKIPPRGDIGEDQIPIFDSKDKKNYRFIVNDKVYLLGGDTKEVKLENLKENTEYEITADTIGGVICVESVGDEGMIQEWADENKTRVNISLGENYIIISKKGGEPDTDYFFSIKDHDGETECAPQSCIVEVGQIEQTRLRTRLASPSNANYSEYASPSNANYNAYALPSVDDHSAYALTSDEGNDKLKIHTDGNGNGKIKIILPSQFVDKNKGSGIYIDQIVSGFHTLSIIQEGKKTEQLYKEEDGPEHGSVKLDELKEGGTLIVTNTYTKNNNPTLGVLTIHKKVEGKGAKLDDTFWFRVTLYDKNGNKANITTEKDKWADYRADFDKGEAYIELKDGETHSIINLPEGYTYAVEEMQKNADGSYKEIDDFDDWGYVITKIDVTGKGANEFETYKTRVKGKVIPGQTNVKFVNSTGSYKIVHEYYRVEKDGTWTKEGYTDPDDIVEGPLPLNDSIEYTAKLEMQQPTYEINGVMYTYTHDSDQYGKTTTEAPKYVTDENKKFVKATKDGEEVIILRYIRKTGSYKVVHEYYLEDKDGKWIKEGNTDPDTVEDNLPLDNKEYEYTKDNTNIEQLPEYKGNIYGYHSVRYGSTKNDGDGYGEVDGMSCVKATEDGKEIIILRYVRKLPSDPELPKDPKKGSYKVVHEYYFVNSDGSWTKEGNTSLESVGNLPLDDKKEYTKANTNIEERPEYNENIYTYHSDKYGSTKNDGDGYGEINGMICVKATENGEQVIILRYIRDSKDSEEPKKGGYKVVHEYYLINEDGSWTKEGSTSLETVGNLSLDDTKYTADGVEKKLSYNGRDYDYDSSAYGSTTDDRYSEVNGMTYVKATENGEEVIILRYIRRLPKDPENPEDPKKGGYKVVHEYYLVNRDGSWTKEGNTSLETVGGLPLDDKEYTADTVEKKNTYNERVYTYNSSAYGNTTEDGYGAVDGMVYVKVTENGEQVIILRYVRTVPNTPSRPGGGNPGPDPDPDPKTPPTPETPPAPEIPPTPETPPTPDTPPILPELPDPNDPDSPDVVIIMENGVPTTYVKVWNPEIEEFVYIPDGEVPLFGLPRTGGENGRRRFEMLAALSALGVGILTVEERQKKKKEEEER